MTKDKQRSLAWILSRTLFLSFTFLLSLWFSFSCYYCCSLVGFSFGWMFVHFSSSQHFCSSRLSGLHDKLDVLSSVLAKDANIMLPAVVSVLLPVCAAVRCFTTFPPTKVGNMRWPTAWYALSACALYVPATLGEGKCVCESVFVCGCLRVCVSVLCILRWH